MPGQGLAVILLFGISRSDGHIALGHRQGAGFRGHGKLARHIVIFGVLHRCRAGHVHGVAARIRPLGFRRQAGDGVGVALHGEGGRHQPADALFRAVISVAAAVGLHCDLVLGLAVGHRQGAFVLGDVVVIRLGVVVQGVAERVGAAAHRLLAAGEGIACAFAVCPVALRRKGGVSVGQSFAVIFLAQVCRGQRYAPLCHRQSSVNPRNIFKRCCRGAGIFVHYFFCAGYCVIGFAGICLRAGHIDIIVQFELNAVCGVIAIRSFGQFLACIGNGVSIIGQCCPVVDLRAARGFYFKLFCICLCPVSVERGRYRDGKACYRVSFILIVFIPAVESILIHSYL